MLVSVCISTYNRPQGLNRLLKGLNRLTFNRISCPEIEVIVVDNNTKGIAKKVSAAIKEDFRWTLKTDVEPKQGISYARNKSVSLASPKANFIAIIDDDEVPMPNWLEELLLVQKKYSADIVTGYVISRLPKDIPNWIVRGKFFENPSFSTGESRHIAFTNNVLVKGEILRKLDRIFDHRFALTGGEDSELFFRLNSMNYKIVWANEAVVEEWISPTRTNLSSILKRGYRSWSTYSLLEKELMPSFKVQGIRIIKGGALILIGLLKLFPAVLLGRHMMANGLLFIYRGTGTFSGLFGIKNYQLYKNSFEIVE
ncbi:Family 2 glycosyl transferase [Hyella patelloides LEGE 07179]|uniref:Family 2 glycosyl transferase n=1 Tax=Hyella patelloides LEGE 07179 TaxID=945734 RepID=A0A563VUY6_9CYAN|nr:glycosyltransferase family 2 protein [Hyella patelloides]VEP15215.1 Family 2 glycosyl transferase [Hyella patelloides LEGE 07179]